jgi:hypothetical protein
VRPSRMKERGAASPFSSRAEALIAGVADGGAGAHCQHPTHRTVRLPFSYAEAKFVRIQCAEAVAFKRMSVSPLRRTVGAWSFGICGECLASSDDVAEDSA